MRPPSISVGIRCRRFAAGLERNIDQSVNLFTGDDAHRLPGWLHPHSRCEFAGSAGPDLPHRADAVLELGEADKEKALVKTPRQIKDLRESEQPGAPLRLDRIELASPAAKTPG